MSGSSNPYSLFPLQQPVQGRYLRIIYSDVNSHYTIDTNQLVLDNILAVNGEIINLVSTMPGERPFEPEFGTIIPALLFNQPTAYTTWQIEDELFIGIQRWMPYVSIDFNQTSIVPLPDIGEWYFKLLYNVNGLGSNIPVNFQFSI